MSKVKGFIFDMNGTMIDDMAYHIRAWHNIINRLGANLTLEEVKAQCYGKNEELIERVFPGRFSLEEMKQIEHEKETSYQEVYKHDMKTIAGLEEILAKAWKHDIHVAIGSAAIMFNIDFILDGLSLRPYFKTIVSADHVEVSKPDPETFLKAAAGINVAPEDCVVFEDAPKGIETALNAGMKCVVLTTMHNKEEFDNYPNVIGFINDYTDPLLNQLFEN